MKGTPRFFPNPCIEKNEDHSNEVTPAFIQNEMTVIIEEIKKARTPPDCDVREGVYVGSGGDGYAIMYAARVFPERKEEFIDLCLDYVETQLDKADDSDTKYLLGGLGLEAVRAVANYQKNGSLPEDFVDRLKRNARTVGRKKLPNELFVGRAGFLAALLFLRSYTSETLVPVDKVKRVIDSIIDAGTTHAKRIKADVPLMYEYYGSHYLGAAHGLTGILQMLISYWSLLDEKQRRLVKSTLDWIIDNQSPDGNFSSTYEDPDDTELVHWCHGATGTVMLLITAYTCFEEERVLKAAERALDLIWRKGILRKGPGLCHGLSGNGYAFLLFYRLTKKEKYLNYARSFAHIMRSREFRRHARVPDNPSSLFEGIAGSLCFLADLTEPMKAQFPMIPVIFDKSLM